MGASTTAGGLVVRPGGASIDLADQSGPWGTVHVERVVTPVPSLVVVQAQQGAAGTPAAVVGYAAVPAGTTSNVDIALDPRQGAVNTLVVTLLADRGRTGVLEFTPAVSGGGGGMGMAAQPSQGGAAGAATSAGADKPLVAGGALVSATLLETFRSGTPGIVRRSVGP